MDQSKKKILLIEDAKDYQLMILRILENDYNVICAETRAIAFSYLESQSFDLIITDIMLPDSDGYQICREIRGHTSLSSIPIIFVSSRNQTPDKLMAFTLGADDYVEKPFHPNEFKARVKANINRPHSPQVMTQEENIHLHPFEVSLSSQRLFITQNGIRLETSLTKTEFLIFTLFLKSPDRVFSRAQILEKIWGSDVRVTDRTVDTHISKLRAKIEPYGKCLEPVHGFGYRLSLSKLGKAA